MIDPADIRAMEIEYLKARRAFERADAAWFLVYQRKGRVKKSLTDTRDQASERANAARLALRAMVAQENER